MPAPPKKAFPLRIEPALWAALERCAAADFRSVNAEIEVLLREALGRRGVKVAPPEERLCFPLTKHLDEGLSPVGRETARRARDRAEERL